MQLLWEENLLKVALNLMQLFWEENLMKVAVSFDFCMLASAYIYWFEDW